MSHQGNVPPTTSASGVRPGNRILNSIAAGVVVALIDLPVGISVSALIFSGALAAHVPEGIGLALFGMLLIGLVVAATSSYVGTIAFPQESLAAILALMAAAIASSVPHSTDPPTAFLTVVVAIALTTALTGLFFLLLGLCRLGTIVRYIPHPVVGGFLAGSGWLLARGALSFLVDSSLSLSQIPSLFQSAALLRWLPSLAFALLLLAVQRRSSHSLALPGAVAGGIGVFYLVLQLTSTPVSQAGSRGWLLGPFPDRVLWPPLALSDLSRVHWPSILAQGGSVLTVMLIGVVSLLLNTTALELTIRRDMDLNRELRAAGLANLLAGMGGGFPGFHTLSYSTLGYRMRAESRLVGMVPAVLAGLVLLFGASALALFPKPVLGGVLLFLGLAFLVEWLYDARPKLSRAEYAIVVAILIAIGSVGVLAGIALGIVLAVVLFVVSYSRVDVVKHTLSGHSYRSNVDRSRARHLLLRSHGDRIYILELQGFLFFGTAHRLLDRVRQRLSDPNLPSPAFIVLDFRQVTGLDASAVLSFTRMRQVAAARGSALVPTHLSPPMAKLLSTEVLSGDEGDSEPAWCVFPDLDHGVEWCEEQILAAAELAVAEATAAETMAEEAEQDVPSSGLPGDRLAVLMETLSTADDRLAQAGAALSLADTRLRPHMQCLEVPKGHVLIRQGDPPRGLYIVDRGQVTALLETDDGQEIRLRKMGPGSIVGEMGLYLERPASASVRAMQPTTLYLISREALQRIEEDDPELASALHKFIVQLLAERLALANQTIQAVLGDSDR
jgi:SulP family sulfate permease